MCQVRIANYKCTTCGINRVFCEKCITTEHTNLTGHQALRQELIKPLENGGLQKAIFQLNPTQPPCGDPCEQSQKSNYIRCIGLQTTDLIAFTYCCTPLHIQVIRYGFWPVTILNIQTCISIELFKLYRLLLLNCQVSVKGFCKSIYEYSCFNISLDRFCKLLALLHY